MIAEYDIYTDSLLTTDNKNYITELILKKESKNNIDFIYPKNNKQEYQELHKNLKNIYFNNKSELNAFCEQELKTVEDCIEVILKSDIDMMINYIPEKFKTYEVYLAAVKKYRYMLRDVPDNLITYDMCLFAVRYIHSFEMVPKKFRTKELFLTAIKNDPCLIIHDEEYEFDSAELYALRLDAVTRNGYALHLIREQYITRELCVAALISYPEEIEVIQEQYLTPDLLLEVAKKNGEILEFLNENDKSYEICMAAVTQRGYALEYVPEKFKTYEMSLASIKSSGEFDVIPTEHLTAEMYITSIFSGKDMIDRLPDEYRTPEICIFAALDKNIHAFKHIPENLKTYELCLSVVKRDIRQLLYVPKNFSDKIMQYIYDNKHLFV